MDLLTELHWSRDHPLSDAELNFKSKELPELEKHVKTLGTKIKVTCQESCKRFLFRGCACDRELPTYLRIGILIHHDWLSRP